MNALSEIKPDLSEPVWALRWQLCRGTSYEDQCLLSIAIEAEQAGLDDYACAAADAANSDDMDERREFIAELERLFREQAAAEDEADQAYRYEVRTGRAAEPCLPGAVA